MATLIALVCVQSCALGRKNVERRDRACSVGVCKGDDVAGTPSHIALCIESVHEADIDSGRRRAGRGVLGFDHAGFVAGRGQLRNPRVVEFQSTEVPP